ncbi:hypothetical protein [Bradyrhizobium sp. SZCCHNPS2010]|uniref:hypothetical protein n=1 Tax=Bradyrhizobium sp. SZCCHNPS2010 TaxID=3057333 RepID=UPI0029169588|nr:hypothetical protein [Bradyrhizobium sp. SZCCHNPS2010]
MRRYIIIADQSCAVFFDEIASDPYAAIKAGEAKIGAGATNLEPCRKGDFDSLYSVYQAPIDFEEIGADDALMVTEKCEYVGTFREAAEAE